MKNIPNPATVKQIARERSKYPDMELFAFTPGFAWYGVQGLPDGTCELLPKDKMILQTHMMVFLKMTDTLSLKPFAVGMPDQMYKAAYPEQSDKVVLSGRRSGKTSFMRAQVKKVMGDNFVDVYSLEMTLSEAAKRLHHVGLGLYHPNPSASSKGQPRAKQAAGTL